MSSSDDKFPQSEHIDYDSVLKHISNAVNESGVRSWDNLQDQIKQAVEMELTVEEMTQDELDLLATYLAKDIEQLGHYLHQAGAGIATWLNFDLEVLEQTIADQLKSVADQTRIQHEKLREQLETKSK